MPKNKNKKKAAERKQEEIQRRIEKANKKASPAAGRPTPKPEKPAEKPGRPNPNRKPAESRHDDAPEQKARPRKQRREESRRQAPAAMKLLSFTSMDEDDENGRPRYQVAVPARMDLGGLLKEIRNGQYMTAGNIYVSLWDDGRQSGMSDAIMIFAFQGGLYTRSDMPKDKKSRKTTAWLADTVDRHVLRATACGDRDHMDWYVTLRPELSAQEPEAVHSAE